jgi:hypothetical protein
MSEEGLSSLSAPDPFAWAECIENESDDPVENSPEWLVPGEAAPVGDRDAFAARWFSHSTNQAALRLIASDNRIRESYETGVLEEGGPNGEVSVASMDGTKRVNDMLSLFSLFPSRLVSYQRTFRDRMLHTLLPQFYCKDWAAHSTAICHFYGITHWKQILACVTSRQMGKTTTLALFLAAAVIYLPNKRGLVCSTGGRASTQLRDLVVSALQFIRRGTIYSRGEQIWVTHNGSTNSLAFFPDNSVALRGQRGDYIVVEEAGFVPRKLWSSFILPLLLVKLRGLICISSPGAKNMFYDITTLPSPTYPGELAANVVSIATSCAECAHTNLAACTHVPDNTPFWKDEGGNSLMSALMAKLNPETYNREVRGIFDNAGASPAISHALLDTLSVAPTRTFGPRDEPPETGVLAFDMSGGGNSDDAFTLTSLTPTVDGKYRITVCRCARSLSLSLSHIHLTPSLRVSTQPLTASRRRPCRRVRPAACPSRTTRVLRAWETAWTWPQTGSRAVRGAAGSPRHPVHPREAPRARCPWASWHRCSPPPPATSACAPRAPWADSIA